MIVGMPATVSGKKDLTPRKNSGSIGRVLSLVAVVDGSTALKEIVRQRVRVGGQAIVLSRARVVDPQASGASRLLRNGRRLAPLL